MTPQPEPPQEPDPPLAAMESPGLPKREDDQNKPTEHGQASDGRTGEGAEAALQHLKEIEQRRQDGATGGAPS